MTTFTHTHISRAHTNTHPFPKEMAVSQTNDHKCSFSELCSGDKKGYAMDNITPITNMTISEAKTAILQHMETCIKNIEAQRSPKKVLYIYIGTAQVRRRGDFMYKLFDKMRCSTWSQSGINRQFLSHRNEYYCKDGLVVLTAITKDAIPQDCMESLYMMHPEEYALCLEKRLLQHLIEAKDERLSNETVFTSELEKTTSVAYTIYMTFTVG